MFFIGTKLKLKLLIYIAFFAQYAYCDRIYIASNIYIMPLSKRSLEMIR